MTFRAPEACRIRDGEFASTRKDGNNGAFRVQIPSGGEPVLVIASDVDGWEMASIFKLDAAPTREETDYIRDLFWDDAAEVYQIHFPERDRAAQYRFAVKLWSRAGHSTILPPRHLVLGVGCP